MPINITKRYKRQELFNPTLSDFQTLTFDSDWNIYKNANLSIHVTDKCNADCNFCIAHLRYLNDGLVYIKPELKNEEDYYQRLDAVLTSVQKLNPSVSITGGEPTVNKKLPSILKILSSHNVRKRTITSNGTGLFLKYHQNQTIFDALSDYRLEHLNISRAHFDSHKNSQIMVMAEHLMPEGMLEEIIQEAKRKNINVRLSCALLKSGISKEKDIMEYIDWGHKIGVENIIFRQLMQFDDKKVKAGRIPNYCLQEEVDLFPIWNFLDQNKDFELYHQVLGYYYYVEVRKFKHMNIVSESADLRIINSQLDKFKQQFHINTAFELVFHPNGNLCAGWNENEQIMSIMKN